MVCVHEPQNHTLVHTSITSKRYFCSLLQNYSCVAVVDITEILIMFVGCVVSQVTNAYRRHTLSVIGLYLCKHRMNENKRKRKEEEKYKLVKDH